MKSLNKNKVVLGLSGGVDSTAAALLLQEKGYEVIGLYFSIKDDIESIQKAENTAKQLGIKLIVRNVSCQFEDIVINNFCSEYMKGRTPNPCIVCNPAIKFSTLLEAADENDAYYIATGHYADTYYNKDTDTWHIKKASNERKDQSYMLYRLGQEAISRLLLPLNNVENKEQVREFARKKAMKNANDKDSQEICFIDADDNYKNFLSSKGIKSTKGNFIDTDGNVLGKHQGILNYTIGQRKGLGITLGKPAFVTAINTENNTVTLGDNSDLFNTEVISDDNIILNRDCHNITAKIRYAAKPAQARLEFLQDGKIKTIFKEPQRAATPGQSIVFYKDELVIGGGFIS